MSTWYCGCVGRSRKQKKVISTGCRALCPHLKMPAFSGDGLPFNTWFLGPIRVCCCVAQSLCNACASTALAVLLASMAIGRRAVPLPSSSRPILPHVKFGPDPRNKSGLDALVLARRATTIIQWTGSPGPDLREGKLGSCPGPPQLGGLHKNTNNYYLRKHKNTFRNW